MGRGASTVASWPIVGSHKSKKEQICGRILADFEQKGQERGRTFKTLFHLSSLILGKYKIYHNVSIDTAKNSGRIFLLN